MKDKYRRLLEELNDILEGGDVSLDFESMPSAGTTLLIISDIVGNALRDLDAIENFWSKIKGAFE